MRPSCGMECDSCLHPGQDLSSRWPGRGVPKSESLRAKLTARPSLREHGVSLSYLTYHQRLDYRQKTFAGVKPARTRLGARTRVRARLQYYGTVHK